MRIGVAGSMQFARELVRVRDELRALGHDAYVNEDVEESLHLSPEEQVRLAAQEKGHGDYIRKFWRRMQGGDALLVVNITKGGVEHYVGPNALIEIGFAIVLDQQVFLLNPVPRMQYTSEILAADPIILDQDLTRIPSRAPSTR